MGDGRTGALGNTNERVAGLLEQIRLGVHLRQAPVQGNLPLQIRADGLALVVGAVVDFSLRRLRGRTEPEFDRDKLRGMDEVPAETGRTGRQLGGTFNLCYAWLVLTLRFDGESDDQFRVRAERVLRVAKVLVSACLANRCMLRYIADPLLP